MSKNEYINKQSMREEKFLQLFMAHQRTFYAFILASIHNYSDAEDILQEAAAVMWRRIDEFKEGTNFVSWGLVISRYHVLNYFNSRKRSRLRFDDELLNELADLTLEEASKIDPLTEALRQCYNRLSDTNRMILKFRYEDGMTIKAVANTVGKPIHAMYKTVARLQDALQSCIGRVLQWEGTV